MRRQFCISEAKRLRRELNITQPPVPIEEIAKALFLEIKVKTGWLRSRRALLRRELGEIWVNGEESRRAQRFLVGHEVGHFVLHRNVTVFSEHADEDSAEYSKDPMKELDKEADFFSSVLLVPPDWLTQDVNAGLTPDELSERYWVSREVIFIALDQHQLLRKVSSKRR